MIHFSLIGKTFEYYLIMWTQLNRLCSSLWRKNKNRLSFLYVLKFAQRKDSSHAGPLLLTMVLNGMPSLYIIPSLYVIAPRCLVPVSYSSLYLVCSTGFCCRIFTPLFFDEWFSQSIILILFHKSRCFSFPFHIWSVIPDILTLPRHTALRCSSSLSFCGRHVSTLCTLPKQNWMEYT